MVRAEVLAITPENMDKFDGGAFEHYLTAYVVGTPGVSAFAFVVDGRCVAYGGWYRVYGAEERVGEGFFAADDAPPYVFVQARKKWLEITAHLERVQCEVDIMEPTHIRFAYALGMSPEGIMHNVGPNGEDWIMFARVK